MGDRNQVIGNTSWIHRLPPYLYVSALVHGKRVIELGCGSGDGARFLAGCGAASVTAVDPGERVVEEARRRHRAAGLSFERRDLDDLEFHDNAFHCAFLPEAGAVLHDSDAVVELRRVLSPRGHLVACAAAVGPGAVEYDELVALLEPSFGPPTMIAQGPFVAVSLVEYAEQDGVVPSVELDTSLLARGGGEQVARYVAVCGARPAQPRPLAIVQVPAGPGLAALATLASADGGESAADGAGSREDAARDRTDGDQDARDARDARDAMPREAGAASDAEAAVAPAVASGARDDRARPSEPEPSERSPEPSPEPLGRGATGPQARGVDSSVSQRIAGALDAHARHAATLERALQDQRAYVAELERELADAEQRIAREADRRAGVEAQLARRDGELKEWRHRASVAEGEVLRRQLAAADPARSAPAPRPSSPPRAGQATDQAADQVMAARQAQRVAELERMVADLERTVAERDRALEERARAHAEQVRAQAEQAQAEAEQARESDWAHDQQAEELAELRSKLERVTANWREAEAKNDDVWRRVGELQSELERHREESVARSAKQAQDARVQLARAREDGIQKVVAMREQLRQSEAAAGDLERALHAERAGRRELEAVLAEREQASTRDGNGAARRIGEVRQELRAMSEALAAERDAARAIEAGLAALERERRDRAASTPAESRAQELAFELGVKDAELMLLGSGVAALQERLASVRAHVERARAEMADGDAAALRAVMERLAAEVSRLAGAQ